MWCFTVFKSTHEIKSEIFKTLSTISPLNGRICEPPFKSYELQNSWLHLRFDHEMEGFC